MIRDILAGKPNRRVCITAVLLIVDLMNQREPPFERRLWNEQHHGARFQSILDLIHHIVTRTSHNVMNRMNVMNVRSLIRASWEYLIAGLTGITPLVSAW